MIVSPSFWHDAAHYLLSLLLAVPFGAMFYYVVNRFLRVRRTWWARAAVLVAGTVAAFNVVYVADAFNILFFYPSLRRRSGRARRAAGAHGSL